MLLDDARALAIEAKWTEPRYTTVRVWLDRGNGDPLFEFPGYRVHRIAGAVPTRLA